MIKNEISQQLDLFRAGIFPDRCCFCNEPIEYKTEICPSCREKVKKIERPRCFACGTSKKDCNCKGKANFYNGITGPYFYKGLVKDGIIRWKYGEAAHSVQFFAKEIANCIKEDFGHIRFDAVTFIPQTKKEQMEKGYNQSELLAAEVGNRLNIPNNSLIKKLFDTQRQHDLPLYLRSGNVFGVFGCGDKNAVSGKTILLIDDIKTSGKTLNECAKVLHLNDTAEVYCAVIALSDNQSKNKKP